MPEERQQGSNAGRLVLTDLLQGVHHRFSVVPKERFDAALGAAVSRAVGAETDGQAKCDGEQGVSLDEDARRRIVARTLDELRGAMSHPDVDPDLKAAAKMVEHVLPMVRKERSALLEEKLHKLTRAFLDVQGAEGPVFTEDMILENARQRARFLTDWRMLNSRDVATIAGHRAKNAAATASRWRSRGLLFAISTVDGLLFPEFQFRDGEPHPTIGTVLSKLPDSMTDWEKAFWLTSPNGYLDGRRPVQMLNDVHALAGAAEIEAQGWSG